VYAAHMMPEHLVQRHATISRLRRWVAIGGFLVGLPACERGCLASWLHERGIGGKPPEGPGRETPPGNGRTMDLSGTDCSDGLLRCVAGHVEASRPAHITTGECPWDDVMACPCASDGLTVLGSPDGGAPQLCRPDHPVARPILPGDPVAMGVCPDEHIGCREGVIEVCDRSGASARSVAFCLSGCAVTVALDDSPGGAPGTLDGLVPILCRHQHAERR
jgi:hypothetical protein